MNKHIIELKWAIIFMVSMLLWMVLEKVSGLHNEHVSMHSSLTNLFAIVAFTVYILALWEKRKFSYGGIMTWKQGFISGLIISAIIAILSPIGQLISHYVISPDFFTNVAAEAVRQKMMTSDEAANYFNFKNYLIQSVAGALIMGLVTSAIASLIVTNINNKSNDVSTR